jgi:hypothetical protein
MCLNNNKKMGQNKTKKFIRKEDTHGCHQESDSHGEIGRKRAVQSPNFFKKVSFPSFNEFVSLHEKIDKRIPHENLEEAFRPDDAYVPKLLHERAGRESEQDRLEHNGWD